MTRQEYRGIDGDIPSIEDHSEAGKHVYYAAIIYAFFIFISVARMVHLVVLGRRAKAAPNMDDYTS